MKLVASIFHQYFICTWHALRRGLPTHDNLQCRGISLASRCPLSCNEAETIDHLLWSCEYSRRVWNLSLPQLCMQTQLESTLLGVANLITTQFQQQHTFSRLFCAVTTGLWTERNCCWFDDQHEPTKPLKLCNEINFSQVGAGVF